MSNNVFDVTTKGGNNGPNATAIVSYPMLRYYKITDGADTYHCYAKPGSQLSGNVWAIALEDSGTSGIISVKFAQKDSLENEGFVHQLSTNNLEVNILATISAYTYGS